jgi:signal transduction histidine kinase
MPAKTNPVSETERLTAENARLRGDLLTLAHRIAHDLRTPLGGILSSGEVLKEILTQDRTSVVITDSLLQSANEMSQLIRRASFLAKASARPREKELLNMAEAVSSALQQLESRLLKVGALVKEPPTWPQVNGVMPWLEVVWWNLLANAIDHAGASPKIELGWRLENGKYYFWINDSGGGVSENAKLFQPFHLLHELNGARGLGLSIVQRLVELQDGECGHEKGETGSHFYFTLPA